ncbi:hypothetical protein A3C89_01650 [Candidatus Kaiserbacteria bacterium RIFCSPHIGHO2_02_FULL_50_50]|uniref:Glycosyl transferase family 11 n=1 Tax=Candidatus Kaiserbacteria bacterium RIFCSPHIGHO2_02_FULL_50_50 TaxID=1798492 RepID=A0A1F6DCD8_9BACT|nr:MAG: hypothetical protein A3C89_01650 [Candidatus Kaiserbacteria bacterium RIFCSPHIGHO2_02_FULL_50_50]OGG88158.1 MAG: hypothetical protein A3G62_02685 [Candidatus Kaiserbacteria bacterium RIFCSPLOWO2_12_FULL_50_10]
MHKTVIVKLKGGMGNQMFQYAFSRALIAAAKGRGDTVHVDYDITAYTSNGRVHADTLRTFDLQKLSCEIPLASERSALSARTPYGFASNILRRVLRKFFTPDIIHYDKRLLTTPYRKYYEGYWQSEKYFKGIEAEIRKHFTFRDPLDPVAQAMKEKIENDPYAVGIFFRRTDYVGHSDLDVCDEAYYSRALAKMHELVPNMHLYVMSDDIEWVKQHAKLPEDATYVSSPSISYIEEMEISTACKHHIIPNSTFAWWGAWLSTNHDKIIIAPKLWSKSYNDTNFKDIIPESKNWLRI